MDYSALATAISFTDVLAALGSVAISVGGLYLAIRGGRAVLSFVRR